MKTLSTGNLVDLGSELNGASVQRKKSGGVRRTAARAPKLESLRWGASCHVIAYGVRMGVRAIRPEDLEKSLGYLPLGWKPCSPSNVSRLYSIVCNEPEQSSAASFDLFCDHHAILRSATETAVLEKLESDSALYIAEMTERRVFVHAGVVGWNGRAILLPGRSCTGKTTLVAELVRWGATYYSDEFAVLDERGFLHPYPRPLGLRENGSLRQTRCPVERLGGSPGAVPLPPALVILSRFKTGTEWRPRHISPGRALLGLLDNAVSARRNPAAALKTLKQVVNQSFAVKGVRGEGQQVVDWISKYFDPQKGFPLPGS